FQRFHTRFAFTLRHPRLAQRPGNAGRDRAAAKLVSLPSVQGVLLGTDGSGAAIGAAGAAPAREKSARRPHRRAFYRAPGFDWAGAEGAASALDLVPVVSRHRCHSPAGRAALSKKPAPAR